MSTKPKSLTEVRKELADAKLKRWHERIVLIVALALCYGIFLKIVFF